MPASEVTDLQLVQSLGSTTCPACSGTKKRAQTFCRRCYFQLPAEARSMLYRRVGRGYREAVIASLGTLGVAEPTLPESK